MADYKLTSNSCVQRVSDGAFIPNDPGNADRREYSKWLSEGNTPDPYVAPEVIQLTLDQIYDDVIQNQKVLKALVLALNDGSLPVGTNKSNAQLKTIIKAKM